jgi:hypothetical protein
MNIVIKIDPQIDHEARINHVKVTMIVLVS